MSRARSAVAAADVAAEAAGAEEGADVDAAAVAAAAEDADAAAAAAEGEAVVASGQGEDSEIAELQAMPAEEAPESGAEDGGSQEREMAAGKAA